MTNIDRKIAFLLATSPYLDTVDSEYDEAAMDLTANGVTIQKWISVKDRLPELYQTVLVFKKRMAEPESYITTDRRVRLYGDDMVWLSELHTWRNSVTHWMPLPEPPKEDAK